MNGKFVRVIAAVMTLAVFLSAASYASAAERVALLDGVWYDSPDGASSLFMSNEAGGDGLFAVFDEGGEIAGYTSLHYADYGSISQNMSAAVFEVPQTGERGDKVLLAIGSTMVGTLILIVGILIFWKESEDEVEEA